MNRDKTYKVAIAEHFPVISEGISRLIDSIDIFSVVYSTDCVDHLLEKMPSLNADILIINPAIIDFSKRDAVRSLFHGYSHVIIVAMVSSYIEQAILKQYDGVLGVDDNTSKIESKLHDAISAHNEDTGQTSDDYELTRREIEVLIAAAKGLMNKEIADELNISVHTVISHRKNISRKTGIKSVAGLTVYALLNNLIDQSEVS